MSAFDRIIKKFSIQRLTMMRLWHSSLYIFTSFFFFLAWLSEVLTYQVG